METRRIPTRPAAATAEQCDLRAYIFDMIKELEKMARSSNELEVAIHLAAILEAAHAGKRRRVG